MTVEIAEVGADDMGRFADIPITFEVESVLRVDQPEGGLGGLTLTEKRIARPYTKDYDQFEGERPSDWSKRFDLSSWGLFLALEGGQAVGGAAVAFSAPQISLLDGRTDLAFLWDIRVHPAYRRRGIGGRLFLPGG